MLRIFNNYVLANFQDFDVPNRYFVQIWTLNSLNACKKIVDIHGDILQKSLKAAHKGPCYK